MKKTLLLFILICTAALFNAQENAFIINNKQVVWQRIYTTDKNLNEIKETLLSSGKINVSNEGENYISGYFDNFIMDFKGAGYSLMGTPSYLNSNSKFGGFYKLEIKEGKYRVTVTGIKFAGDSWSLYSGGIGISDDGKDNLETYALTNDREYFRGAFMGKSSIIIDHSFSHLFDVSKYEKQNDNW